LWNGIQAGQNGKVAEAAKADPSGHKLTRVFEAGMNYRYISAEKDGRGRAVRYCWSSHRNVAGYFLGWREVVGKKQTKRDMWSARRVRRKVADLARTRADRTRILPAVTDSPLTDQP